ncbi:Copia type Polyprotein [Phytophthora megakarya]|uniref:Copia type Polyprotein n=1 Tax=Phytophthora megakarya TaxID=4795 RepID=A0A225VU78_9STRA|nr:Copia type Polyprotein [Phytophthora megakarya]
MDNESARKLAKNPEFHRRTKHIDVRHHFIRERIEKRQIEVSHIAGANNVVDIFTKYLPRVKFEKHRRTMGYCRNWSMKTRLAIPSATKPTSRWG